MYLDLTRERLQGEFRGEVVGLEEVYGGFEVSWGALPRFVGMEPDWFPGRG